MATDETKYDKMIQALGTSATEISEKHRIVLEVLSDDKYISRYTDLTSKHISVFPRLLFVAELLESELGVNADFLRNIVKEKMRELISHERGGRKEIVTLFKPPSIESPEKDLRNRTLRDRLGL